MKLINLHRKAVGIALRGVCEFGAVLWNTLMNAHKARVVADSGTVRTQSVGETILQTLIGQDLYDKTLLLFSPETGLKTRATTVSDTPLTFVSKGYSIQLPTNDLTQTTELSQPYLSGNIAPNERYGVKNSNLSQHKIITHPLIKFDNIPYSITICFNCFGKSGGLWDAIVRMFDSTFGGNNYIAFGGSSGISIDNVTIQGNTFTLSSVKKYFGKNTILTITSDFISNESKLFINNQLIQTLTVYSGIQFGHLFGSADRMLLSNILYHRIQSGAMTAPQVAAEHAMLRSIYPEIESVEIGTQTWATSNSEMVATPMGNVIPEVRLAADTSRITNGTFDTDTVWTKGTGVTISDGVCTFTNVADGVGVSQTITSLPIGRNIKVTFTINSITAGGIRLGTIGTTRTTAGTYTEFISLTAALTSVLLRAVGTTSAVIDNVAFEEVGWAGMTLAYNGFVAQGDTAAVATRKAAAWCYYNNDANIGAIMGKLYNPFAAKLMANDIAAYNAANPTHWGWNTPTRAQLTTLSAQGGNASKVGGTNYWTTANGTNTNGLTLLGSGIRQANGTFAELRATTGLLCRDADFVRKVLNADNSFDEAAITTEGYPIRLIKD